MGKTYKETPCVFLSIQGALAYAAKLKADSVEVHQYFKRHALQGYVVRHGKAGAFVTDEQLERMEANDWRYSQQNY